jgi:hypothetical protein|tara:strand:- start:45 stop:224 length:180 start_codon:yes stop_codon:yes gene_type:complete
MKKRHCLNLDKEIVESTKEIIDIENDQLEKKKHSLSSVTERLLFLYSIMGENIFRHLKD